MEFQFVTFDTNLISIFKRSVSQICERFSINVLREYKFLPKHINL